MIHIILSIVLAVLFVFTGAGKVLGLRYANGMRDTLRVNPTFWRVAGLLEWLGAAGLIVGGWGPIIGILASGCLTLFMIAAAISRIRAARIAGTNKGLAAGVTADLGLAVVAAVTFVLCLLGL